MHGKGITDALTHSPLSAKEVSLQFGLPLYPTAILLQFVCECSTIICMTEKDDKIKYVINPEYCHYLSMGHLLDKLIGAYGGLLSNIDEVLSSPSLGKYDHQLGVSHEKLCDAFSKGGTEPANQTIELIKEYIPQDEDVCFIDLGCGPANLLCVAAKTFASFSGIGIDISEPMCKFASDQVENLGLTHKITIINGEVRDLEKHVKEIHKNRENQKQSSEKFGKEFVCVFAGSIINEFFYESSSEALNFLKNINSLFPHCTLFVSDYYGYLGNQKGEHNSNLNSETHTHTILHDVAQCISGQGVPPGSREDWVKLYKTAGFSLIDFYDFTEGMHSFLHICQAEVPLGS